MQNIKYKEKEKIIADTHLPLEIYEPDLSQHCQLDEI
jgi:hypothetical protein